MFSEGPKAAVERTQRQLQKVYSKTPIKTKIWCRVVEVTSLQIFWTVQFLHDTISHEESGNSIDIKFAQRASLNPESEVVEVEVNGNALVEKEVAPPEKKRKVEPWQKPMIGKSKQTMEDISTTYMMLKTVSSKQ